MEVVVNGVRRPRICKQMNRNQMIRMKEIFGPFFKTLEDYCESYVIYKCTIYGEMRRSSAGKEIPVINFDFSVSSENGSLKRDYIVYRMDTEEVLYNKSFKFEESAKEKVANAVRKIVYDFNSITTRFNKITAENGSKWISGIMAEDVGKDGQLYEGYVIFLKSDRNFNEYALASYEEDVEIY